MASQGTKRDNLISANQFLVKKPTSIWSSPPAIKKSIPAQSLSSKVLPLRWYDASIKYLFEKKINSRHDKNNHNNKAANNNFSLERLNDDDDVQFILFDF